MSNERKKADRDQISRFKVDIILGQGGTGTVYRGQDPDTKEIVALKLFRANFFRNSLHMRDLAKMAKKAKKLDHPNVVKIYEFIKEKELQCLVLEYVDGPDLKWYIQNRPWNLEERLVVSAQICNGLACLHEHDFLHHDLKPGNVLFTRQGQVKLVDFSLFGASTLQAFFDTGFGEQITPMYVSPEIIQKKKGTHLSDIYSLGIMFYLMFAQRVPFETDNLQQLYHAHLNTMPTHPSVVNPECPQPLGDIIMRLLSKEPEKRFQTADQLRISMSNIGRSRI